MLDIVERLKSKNAEVVKREDIFSAVLFNQTSECRVLIEEAFRFEGFSTPASLENIDENIRRYVRDSSIEVVLVELNRSQNVALDMERIASLLPNHASVIVIGSEDAISTIRNLKAMGFYYLFWPITKVELVDFVKHVYENRKKQAGLGKNRIAKKVAFWGSKGGLGTTLLTSEVGLMLSSVEKSSCVIVDHNFTGGELDVFLGIPDFEKRTVQKGSMGTDMDFTYAMSMTKKVTDMLSVLSIESSELNKRELKEYIRVFVTELAKQNNFVLEDLSRSGNTKSDLLYVSLQCDIFVLIIDPTVSSVREAGRVMSVLNEIGAPLRCILVMNHTRPETSASITRSEIENFLGEKIDVVCAFDKNACKDIIEGKHLYQLNTALSRDLHKLTGLILGQQFIPYKGFSIKRLLKGII
ncbi:chromosome partitioning protein ParA [Moritella sp. 5]|uniref:AAA family ATPase n=1 Tax=Moritella sp. 5 TaxID=2746231 RepID=UPI001BA4B7DC|nr:chromosome partitioning protein ParA [Moritella sp. 5]QUM81967.1 chromosome partitioning protein ParA [Moritella sp. 5]